MNKKIKQLARRYGRKTDVIEIAEDILEERYHVTAFANPDYPVITADPEIQIFQWGLIPFWVKSEEEAKKIRARTYNARAESVFEKPSFRIPVERRRCLIPSTGWFDWRHEKGKKIPYFIYLKNEEIFSMAGIYDCWVNPATGEVCSTFSILTTEANSLMHYIHNTNFRMPVILHPEEEEQWLYPELKRQDIEAYLHPLEDRLMEAYVIENDFLKRPSHDPATIEPASAPVSGDS